MIPIYHPPGVSANPAELQMRPQPVVRESSSLSKYEEMTRRKQKRENRKSKNLLSEFNSEEIPGHQFDLDAVLQVFVHVEVLLI